MGSPLGKIDQQDHAIYEQTRWGIGVVRIILQQEKGVFSPSQKRWWLFSSNKMGGHEFTIILEVWQEHWDLYNYQTSVIAVWLSWWLGLVFPDPIAWKKVLDWGNLYQIHDPQWWRDREDFKMFTLSDTEIYGGGTWSEHDHWQIGKAFSAPGCTGFCDKVLSLTGPERLPTTPNSLCGSSDEINLWASGL